MIEGKIVKFSHLSFSFYPPIEKASGVRPGAFSVLCAA